MTHFDLIHEMYSGLFKNGYLQTCGEAHQICAQSEAGALSCSNTDRGRDRVKNGKNDGGEHSERGDLIQRQGALRDEDGGGGDNETLNEVLNNAIDNFSKSVAHHDFYIYTQEKIRAARRSLHDPVGEKSIGSGR